MMTSTTGILGTGTAEVKRRVQGLTHDPYSSKALPKQLLVNEPDTCSRQVINADGKCTCCPFGYHIDLDFLQFCQDLEAESTLKNLRRIQKAKRTLRKSMEVMVSSQEGNMSDPSSAPGGFVNSNEAERLLQMITYEQSASQDILRHIDSSIVTTASYIDDESSVWKHLSSVNDDNATSNIPLYKAEYSQDEPSHKTLSYPVLFHGDSTISLSSESSMSSEAEHVRHQQHLSGSGRTTTKVVENPVLEMATAEMKHYSTTSSAELVDKRVTRPGTSSSSDRMHIKTIVPSTTTACNIPTTSPAASNIPTTSPAAFNIQTMNETTIQAMREAMAESFRRIKVLEEQVKTIPILQVRLSVLKEEKRLLNLQLKTSKSRTQPQTSSVGVGDESVNVIEEKGQSNYFSRTFQYSVATTDAAELPQVNPGVKSPPSVLWKSARTSSIGVGDHNVLELYNLQPDLPTGYILQQYETDFEIYSRTALEDEKLRVSKNLTQSLKTSFQHTSSLNTSSNTDLRPSTNLNVSPDFRKSDLSVDQIQRSFKLMTRNIGTGEGNVFEDSKLHVQEKELRTLIIGSNHKITKRNVGIECRVQTRDVGVSFKCEDEKPETRTVGINVNYDTSGIHTSLDFKGETELRMALRSVLQRNVRSVGTNCVLQVTTAENSTMTDVNVGVDVGCGDEDHNIDVEIRQATMRKSVAVTARPDIGHKCVSTNVDWALNASTNTYQIDRYHKSVMTEPQKQIMASTNTEATSTCPALNQTEQKVFMSMDQVRHAANNTETVVRYSTGMSTDIIATRNACVNTVTTISNFLKESLNQNNIDSSIKLDSGQNITQTEIRVVDGDDDKVDESHIVRASEEVQARTSLKTLEVTVPEPVTHKSTDHVSSYRSQSENTKKLCRLDRADKHYSSLEISTSSAPLDHGYASRKYSKVSRDKDLDSVLETVSPVDTDDMFSETVVEHFLITKDGKKLISEERVTTTSSGTSRSLRQSTDEGHQVAESTSINHQRSCSDNMPTGDVGGGEGDWDSTNSNRSYSSNQGNAGEVIENTTMTNYQNQLPHHQTEASFVLESHAAGNSSGMYNLSRKVHEDVYMDPGWKKSSQTGRVNSKEAICNKRQAGSVEDFMPDDVRKYMSLHISTSGESGQKLVHRFSDESFSTSTSCATAATSGIGEMKCLQVSQAVNSETDFKTRDKALLQEMTTSEGSDMLATFIIGKEGNGEADVGKEGNGEADVGKGVVHKQSKMSDQDVSALSSSSASETYSSTLLEDQRYSGFAETSSTTNEGMFTDRSITSSTTNEGMFTDRSITSSTTNEGMFTDRSITSSTTNEGMFTDRSITSSTTNEGMFTDRSITSSTTNEGMFTDRSITSSATNEGMFTDRSITSSTTNEGMFTDRSLTSSATNEGMFTDRSITSSATNEGMFTDRSITSSTTNEGMFTDRSITSSTKNKVRISSDGMTRLNETVMTTGIGENAEVSETEKDRYRTMDNIQSQLKSIMKHKTETESAINKKAITFAESVTGGTGSSSDGENNSSDTDSTESSYDGQVVEVVYLCKDNEAVTESLPGIKMFDQDVQDKYEMPEDVRMACLVMDSFLTDSTSIQTKELSSSQDTVQQEWFKLSSLNLSRVHHVEVFLASVSAMSSRLVEYIVNMTDANENTAIHYCVSHCSFEIVGLLLDSKVCEINKRNKAGYTPIMLAGLAGIHNQQQYDTIRRLISFGEINAKATNTQQTALMLAASHGKMDMVKLLTEEGANLNLQDEDGSTALMCACEHGHLEVVNYLLSQPGIDVNITDNENSTALQVAMETGHKDIGVVLYKYLHFSKVPSPAQDAAVNERTAMIDS